jgi:hypothetical protein
MAFAKRKTGGGESFPLVKCDGRVGRLYTQDREQDERGEWHSVQNDVTDGFVAAFNLAGIEHGYMRFPKGAAPETVMVPMGEDIGEMPEGENWQEGLRLQVKMPGEDFWRTLMSSAIGLWRSLDRLHDDYCKFTKQHPGKVPLVELIEVVESRGRTTSYAPTFGIIDWVDPDEVLQRPTEDEDEGQPGKAKGRACTPPLFFSDYFSKAVLSWICASSPRLFAATLAAHKCSRPDPDIRRKTAHCR